MGQNNVTGPSTTDSSVSQDETKAEEDEETPSYSERYFHQSTRSEERETGFIESHDLNHHHTPFAAYE